MVLRGSASGARHFRDWTDCLQISTSTSGYRRAQGRWSICQGEGEKRKEGEEEEEEEGVEISCSVLECVLLFHSAANIMCAE